MAHADFTLNDLLTWARTKPAGERYCYISNGQCAVAQFLLDTGRALRPNVGEEFWDDLADLRGAVNVPLQREIDDASKAMPHIFGALVTRLEALCPRSEWTSADAYMADLESVA